MPPEAVTIADPSEAPHVGSVDELVAINAVGSEILMLLKLIHPLVSVTVTLYKPALSPVALALVCAPGSSHR